MSVSDKESIQTFPPTSLNLKSYRKTDLTLLLAAFLISYPSCTITTICPMTRPNVAYPGQASKPEHISFVYISSLSNIKSYSHRPALKADSSSPLRSYSYLRKNIARPCFTGEPKEILTLQTQF